MNEKPTTKPRDVVQFSSGPKRGMFGQIISADGKCLCRDMDGSQYAFMPGPEESFVVVGTAALGPRVDGPVKPEQASLPPALNPADLLEPLPPDVKAQPMNRQSLDRPRPLKPRKAKSKAAPYTGTRVPFIYTVKNGLGDVVEVTVQTRLDKHPVTYKGTAIILASKLIPPAKPYDVNWRPAGMKE